MVQRILAEAGSQDGVRDAGEQRGLVGRCGDGNRATDDTLFFPDECKVVTLANLRTGNLWVPGEVDHRVAPSWPVGWRGGGNGRVNHIIFFTHGDCLSVPRGQPVGLVALLDKSPSRDVVPDAADMPRVQPNHAGGPVVPQAAAAGGNRIAWRLGRQHGAAQYQCRKQQLQDGSFFPDQAHDRISLTTRPCTSVSRNWRPWNLYVSRSWFTPRQCRTVACRSWTWNPSAATL